MPQGRLDVDPADIPEGTRLVHLGAFPTEDGADPRAEAAVGLAILIGVFRSRQTVEVDEIDVEDEEEADVPEDGAGDGTSPRPVCPRYQHGPRRSGTPPSRRTRLSEGHR